MSSAARPIEISNQGAAPPPEVEFLLSVCGPDRQRTDWKRLIEFADGHGLMPLLSQTAIAGAPPAVTEDVRRRSKASARQALWLTGELLRILELLAANHIDALPYKGPALAEFLYGNVTLRRFSDLDILVHAGDAARVTEILRPLDYSPTLNLSPRERRAYIDSGYEYVFDGPRGRHLVEIQWRIVPRFYAIDFDMEAIFRRTSTIRLNGMPVRSLCPEDLFLILCVHAAKHAWMQISWVSDIAALIRLKSLDWDFVQGQARELGIERIVGLTLCLAERLSGLPLSAAEFPLPGPETLQLCDQVLAGMECDAECDTESLSYFRWMMQLRERRWDRLRLLKRLALTSGVSEWRTVPLPGTLFPLYPVVRAFRLLRRLAARPAE